jgi:hypothetical protein
MNFMSNAAIKKRKYIMHPAHPMVGVSIALKTHVFEFPAVRQRKLFALTGPDERPLAALLQNYFFDFLGDADSFDWNNAAIKARGIPRVDLNPRDVDSLILLGFPAAANGEILEQIYDFWQGGGSLLAVRIADFALRGMGQAARDVFGGEYLNEHLLGHAKITLPSHAGHYQLLREVHPFVSRGGLHRYELQPRAAAAVAFGSAAGETMPVAWVRSRLGRRIFATTLGSAADFRHPCFLRLLANAIVWTAQ